MSSDLTYKDFYKFIEDNFKDKDVILALDTAARYTGELTSSLPEEITVYVKKKDSEFDTVKEPFKIKQIVIKSFFKIEYILDSQGIKYCTDNQIVADILKKSYFQKKITGFGTLSYNFYRIIEGYFFRYTTETGIFKLKYEFKLPKKYWKTLDNYLKSFDEYIECNYEITNLED